MRCRRVVGRGVRILSQKKKSETEGESKGSLKFDIFLILSKTDSKCNTKSVFFWHNCKKLKKQKPTQFIIQRKTNQQKENS